MIRSDQHNAARLQFLCQLKERAPEIRDISSQKESLEKWIAEQRLQVLSSLKKPDLLDIQPLILGAASCGGVDFLKDR